MMVVSLIPGGRFVKPSSMSPVRKTQWGRAPEPAFSARGDSRGADRVVIAKSSADRVKNALPRDDRSSRPNLLDRTAVAVANTFRKMVPPPVQPVVLGLGLANLLSGAWKAMNPKWSSVPHANVTFPGVPTSSVNWPEVNCYSFVSSDREGRHGQPGERSGRMYGAITCDEITAAARRDGYVDPSVNDGCDSECPPGHHLAHFRTTGTGQDVQHLGGLLSSGPDFHVYASERGTDGKMRTVHKQGRPGVPTDKDGSGKAIGCPIDESVNHHYVVNEGIGPFSLPGQYNYSMPCGDFLCAPDEPPPPAKDRGDPIVTKRRVMNVMSATAAAVLGSQFWLSHRLKGLEREAEKDLWPLLESIGTLTEKELQVAEALAEKFPAPQNLNAMAKKMGIGSATERRQIIDRLSRKGLLSDDGTAIKDVLTARVLSEYARATKNAMRER